MADEGTEEGTGEGLAGAIANRAGSSLLGGAGGGDGGDGDSAAAAAAGAEGGDFEQPFLADFEGGRYKTTDALQKGFADVRRGLTAAQQALKGHTGAPTTEDGQPGVYEFAIPEGFEGTIDAESPMFEKVQEWGHKFGISAEAATELFSDVYVPSLAAEIGQNAEAEMEFLTDHFDGAEAAQAAMGEILQWGSDLLGPEDVGLLKAVTRTADGVILADKLRAAFQSVTIPTDTGSGPGMNQTKVDQIMQQPGWETGPEADNVFKWLNQQAS